VQDGAGVALLEDVGAEAVEHVRADDLLAEVRRAQHGHGGEGGLDLVERLELALAPGAEVGPDLLGEDAVDDHGVGQVAVEVQVGEGPPGLVDDHPVGRHHQAHRDAARCRAGSRSSR
jgi:hypothetical protein